MTLRPEQVNRAAPLLPRTDQVLVSAVDGQVAQGDGHSPDHLVGVGAQQLHQDGKTLLLTDGGSDVVGPLEGRQRETCERFSLDSKHVGVDLMGQSGSPP